MQESFLVVALLGRFPIPDSRFHWITGKAWNIKLPSKASSMFGGTRDKCVKCVGCSKTVYPTEKFCTGKHSKLDQVVDCVLVSRSWNQALKLFESSEIATQVLERGLLM